jgi:dephospho-CoA kinase
LLSKDPAYFIKKGVKKIKESGHDRWVIDGVRTPLDVIEFKKSFSDMQLVKVHVEPRLRYKRLKKRGRPGFPDSFDKFKEHEALENKRFSLDKTLGQADHVINNNGSLEELIVKSRLLIKSILAG